MEMRKLNFTTSLKPRGFEHWGLKLGLGNRLEIQALQWSKPCLLVLSKAGRAASLKLKIENRISSLQESPYRFSEQFNRAIEQTVRTYRRTFGLVAALASFPGIADHIIDKRVVAPHDLLIIGLPIMATFVIGHFVKNAAIERTMAVRELKRSEAYFRAVFFENPSAQHILDPEGKTEMVNNRWMKILGYGPKRAEERIIGRHFTTFIPEGERGNAVARWEGKKNNSKRPERPGDRNFLKEDGTPFPVRTKDTVIRDDAGRVMGIITHVEDLSLLNQKMKAALLKSGAAVAKSIMDMVSQDIPAVEGFAVMIQRNIAGLFTKAIKRGEKITEEELEKIAGYARKIEAIADEVKRITDQVSEYENMIHNIQGNDPDGTVRIKTDVLSVLETAKALALSQVDREKVEINIVFEPDLPHIETRADISNTLYYIIKNSLVPASNGIRNVSINVAKENGGIRILITDDRKREEPLSIDRLEEPAFRHGLTYLYFEYLDLQLALFNIRYSGGTLEINAGLGSGENAKEETTFEIYLPLKQGD